MTENIGELQQIIKEQQSKIDKLNNHYSAFFEHTKVGIVKVNIKGSFLEVNKKFCDIVGYSEKELLSLSFKDITYEKDLEKNIEISKSALKNGENSFTLEKRYVRKNGEKVWVEIFINHVKNKNGEYLYTVSLVTDISKRKKIQDTILDQTKTMQLYLDIVDVMIVAINDKGIISLVNRKTCEVLGYEEEEILGRNWFNKFLFEDDKQTAINNYKKAMNRETDIVNKVQYKVVCKNGKKRVISWRRAYIFDEEKNISGVVSSGEDITDIIKLEAKNKKTEQVLLNQSKMASMGEMLRNIAHQWRQPLSTISTAASGIKIQKEFGVLKDEEFFTCMDVIVDTTRYLSHTIDDFQNFFKIDSSVIDFSLKNLLDNIDNLVRTNYKANYIKLILQSNETELFTTYYNDLIQVVINILNNSKDAFEESNLTNRAVFINAKIISNYLYITIKDNAGGIPKDILNRIFEPYFTTKHQSLGTGIGLYMTKDIIENRLHGTVECFNEKITYKSIQRVGAVFKIKIPHLEK